MPPIAILLRHKRSGQRQGPIARKAGKFKTAAGARLWELIGAGDAEIRPRLLHARHGVAQIVVVFQRGAREPLQLFVFENLEPFKVRERCGLRSGQRLRRPEVYRHWNSGAGVVRPHGATAQQPAAATMPLSEYFMFSLLAPKAGASSSLVLFAPDNFSTT